MHALRVNTYIKRHDRYCVNVRCIYSTFLALILCCCYGYDFVALKLEKHALSTACRHVLRARLGKYIVEVLTSDLSVARFILDITDN